MLKILARGSNLKMFDFGPAWHRRACGNSPPCFAQFVARAVCAFIFSLSGFSQSLQLECVLRFRKQWFKLVLKQFLTREFIRCCISLDVGLRDVILHHVSRILSRACAHAVSTFLFSALGFSRFASLGLSRLLLGCFALLTFLHSASFKSFGALRISCCAFCD